jgi:hypothetical protein
MKMTKLNKVDLRQQWTHEARDFTKWLSEPENLDLLSDEIGIGIELIQIEANEEKLAGFECLFHSISMMTKHGKTLFNGLRKIV